MEMVKGQREKLNKYIDAEREFTVLLTVKGSANYAFTCLGVDANEKLYANDYLVSNRYAESPKREIRYAKVKDGGTFKIRLRELPEEINELVFAITIDGEGVMNEVESQVTRFVQEGKTPISMEFHGEDFQNEKSIIVFSIYRKPDWRFRIVLGGFNKGLYGVLKSYDGKDNGKLSTTVGDELDITQYIRAMGRREDEFFINDYIDFYNEKLSDIKKDMQNIYIVNAGAMNHGKSSLFNSLMDSTTFAAQDVRTTMTAESAMWKNNVYLIDTPGLNAEDTDDAEAFNAYRRANIIVYVHTAKIGELHKGELEAINKIKSIYNNDQHFWKHFCLVFSFIDAETKENLAVIKDKSIKDIKEFCGGEGFRVFTVSNSRYQKGKSENKAPLVEKSGIPELRTYLQENFDAWLKENDTIISAARIDRERKEIIRHLEEKKQEIQRIIDKKTNDIKQRQNSFLNKVESAVSSYKSEESELNYKQSLLSSMHQDYDELNNRHKRDRARY